MKANTVEMKRIASEIDSLANEYKILISALYTRFSNMTTDTHEWTGNKANEYVKYVMQDKASMNAVYSKIKSFAKALSDEADLIDLTVAKVRKDETNG